VVYAVAVQLSIYIYIFTYVAFNSSMGVNVWASLLLTRCRNLVGARAILSPCWIFQLVEYFAAGLFVVRDWKYGWVPYTFFTVQIFTKFSHGVQS